MSKLSSECCEKCQDWIESIPGRRIPTCKNAACPNCHSYPCTTPQASRETECCRKCDRTPYPCANTNCDCHQYAQQESQEKVPCSCPKGGMDVDGRVCTKCNGSEWVDTPKTPEAVEDIPELSFDWNTTVTDNVLSVFNKINEIILRVNKLTALTAHAASAREAGRREKGSSWREGYQRGLEEGKEAGYVERGAFESAQKQRMHEAGIVVGRREEAERWMHQPANEHDARIRTQALQEAIAAVPKDKDISLNEIGSVGDYHTHGYNEHYDKTIASLKDLTNRPPEGTKE